MRLAFIIVGLLFLSPLAFGATIVVPDDYPTIQGAINAANISDTVVVRPGTYVENIDFVGKAVTVQSIYGPASTIIDGGNVASVVTFANGEGMTSIIDGFTLTNGFGTGGPNGLDGGGIACSGTTPNIINNIIYDNYADEFGGGISCYASSPRIAGNVIANNFSYSESGGIDCWDSSPLIANNIIARNFAVLAGGGVSCFNSSPEIINNTIVDNEATDIGGGIQAKNDSTINVVNTILWDNTATDGPEIALLDWFGTASQISVGYSDLEGGQASCYVESGCILNWHAGMIDTDPLFLDPTDGDRHLTWDSPCRDTGNNAMVTEARDFEGDPRIALGTVDIGADEYFYHLYHRNAVVPGSSIVLKIVGYPTAPVSLYLGSGLADPPYSTQHGKFYLNWPPLWQGVVGNIPSDGVRVFQVTVPAGWTSGSMHPIQALVGPWGGPFTLLTNADPLVVE